jgi:hypothetical protein
MNKRTFVLTAFLAAAMFAGTKYSIQIAGSGRFRSNQRPLRHLRRSLIRRLFRDEPMESVQETAITSGRGVDGAIAGVERTAGVPVMLMPLS